MDFAQAKTLMLYADALDNPDRPESREQQISQMIAHHVHIYERSKPSSTHVHSEKGRETRSFKSELSRLLQQVSIGYLSHIVKSNPEFSEGLKEAGKLNEALSKEVDLIIDTILPELQKSLNSGDAFLFLLDVFTQNENILQLSAENLAKNNRGPYESTLFWFSAWGLLCQAGQNYDIGKEKEAWVNLIDASYVLGCKRGADVRAKVDDLASASRAAAVNALKKSAPQMELKKYAAELFLAIRKMDETRSVQKITDQIFPLVESKLQTLSDDQVKKERKRISISKPTIYKYLCKLDRALRIYEETINRG